MVAKIEWTFVNLVILHKSKNLDKVYNALPRDKKFFGLVTVIPCKSILDKAVYLAKQNYGYKSINEYINQSFSQGTINENKILNVMNAQIINAFNFL